MAGYPSGGGEGYGAVVQVDDPEEAAALLYAALEGVDLSRPDPGSLPDGGEGGDDDESGGARVERFDGRVTGLSNVQGTDRFFSRVEEQAEESAHRTKRWLDVDDGAEECAVGGDGAPNGVPPGGPSAAAEESRKRRQEFLGKLRPDTEARTLRRPRRLPAELRARLDPSPPPRPIDPDGASSSAAAVAQTDPDQDQDQDPAPTAGSQAAVPSALLRLAWGEELRPLLLQVLEEAPEGAELAAIERLATLHANVPRGERYRKVPRDKLGPLNRSSAALRALQFIGFTKQSTAPDGRPWLECGWPVDAQRREGVGQALRWGRSVAHALHTMVSVLGHPKTEALEALRAAGGDGVRALDHVRHLRDRAPPPPPPPPPTPATDSPSPTADGSAEAYCRGYAEGFAAGYERAHRDLRHRGNTSPRPASGGPHYRRPDPTLDEVVSSGTSDGDTSDVGTIPEEAMGARTSITHLAAARGAARPSAPHGVKAPVRLRELRPDEVLRGVPQTLQQAIRLRMGKGTKRKRRIAKGT